VRIQKLQSLQARCSGRATLSRACSALLESSADILTVLTVKSSHGFKYACLLSVRLNVAQQCLMLSWKQTIFKHWNVSGKEMRWTVGTVGHQITEIYCFVISSLQGAAEKKRWSHDSAEHCSLVTWNVSALFWKCWFCATCTAKVSWSEGWLCGAG